MTKASPARIARKSKKAVTCRNLTPGEAMELQELSRLVNTRRFEAAHIKGNTALIPDGQALAIQAEAVANLLENVKNQWVAAKLVECGYPSGSKCAINLTTGEIVLDPPAAA